MGKEITYGGMAVIEGVMMRGPRKTAIAVRKVDGTIEVEEETGSNLSVRFPFLKWPFIRGTYVLLESLVVGIRMLNKSANLSLDEEDEEITGGEIFLTGVIAMGLAILLFVVFPTTIVHLTRQFWGGVFYQSVVEGIIRIGFFLLYVYSIAKIKDISRVFMYHGAEHKSISAYEAGEELCVEKVRPYSTLHPRCGTSFLLIVLLISILVFALLGEGNLFYRVWSRLAVLPIIAGLGYEFIKFSGKYKNNGIARFIMAPGLWLQKLTTREPDDGQIEIAIAALQAVIETENS